MTAVMNEDMVRCGTPQTFVDNPPWKTFDGNVLTCRALIVPEPEGGFSAHAIRLPGVVSQGETIDEAVENVMDAFRNAIQVYRENGLDVPWEYVDLERPKGALERWILVDV